jgi:hypothetical protein
MMKKSRLALAAATLAASPAFAAMQLGEHFTFSGFGTLGYVQTNSDEGEYRREIQPRGADKTGTLLVDSNLGLQLTGNATDWLSGTVQTLTAMRATDELTTRIEWAFVKVKPLDGLSVRAGKFSLPNFLVSDSRRVGYANNWLRPSNEVYHLDLLDGGLKGADVSWRLPVLGNSLVVTGLYGESSFTDVSTGGTKRDVKNTRGLNLVWDGDWYTLRLGQIKAEPQLSDVLTPFVPSGSKLSDETYTFNGFGFTVDRADVVLQGEYVQRRSSLFNAFIGADAWYLMGGYRMGAFLPYLMVSELKPDTDSFVPPQKTTALGMRWDAFSSAAVKFQLERVDTKGTNGVSFVTPTVPSPFGPMPLPVTKPVTTFSVAVDFVF